MLILLHFNISLQLDDTSMYVLYINASLHSEVLNKLHLQEGDDDSDEEDITFVLFAIP